MENLPVGLSAANPLANLHRNQKEPGDSKSIQGSANVKHSNNSTARTGRRARRICAAYLLAAAVSALGWLYSSLPDHIYLEPGQALVLPRFSYVEPLGSGNTQNVVSTRTVGSYQTTLSIGGIFPVKKVLAHFDIMF